MTQVVSIKKIKVKRKSLRKKNIPEQQHFIPTAESDSPLVFDKPFPEGQRTPVADVKKPYKISVNLILNESFGYEDAPLYPKLRTRNSHRLYPEEDSKRKRLLSQNASAILMNKTYNNTRFRELYKMEDLLREQNQEKPASQGGH
jgi:hypothetical protein